MNTIQDVYPGEPMYDEPEPDDEPGDVPYWEYDFRIRQPRQLLR
jgi:hypothetical protein